MSTTPPPFPPLPTTTSPRPKWLPWAAAALVAVVIAAVAVALVASDDGGDEDVSTVETTVTTAAEPTTSSVSSSSSTSAPSSATTQPADSLTDGRHFGYLADVDRSTSPATVSFDLAEWFSGEAANEAAIEDGVIEPGDTVPNDYYVRNVNDRLRELPVADDVEVLLVSCEAGPCTDGHPGALDDLPGTGTQYWLVVEDGTVVGIEEQYLP